MNIEELLNRYFEGQTTCNEERELRRYFTEESVPEHLQSYCPLFQCIEQERKALSETDKTKMPKKKLLFFKRRIIYMVGGLAACLLLFFGIRQQIDLTPDNYVIIDGKQYTDVDMVREQALAAFRDVSTTEDEVLDLMFE